MKLVEVYELPDNVEDYVENLLIMFRSKNIGEIPVEQILKVLSLKFPKIFDFESPGDRDAIIEFLSQLDNLVSSVEDGMVYLKGAKKSVPDNLVGKSDLENIVRKKVERDMEK